MNSRGKRSYSAKDDFDDKEIADEIRQDIQAIRADQTLTYIEQIQKIKELYTQRKQEKKRRQMLQQSNLNPNSLIDRKPIMSDYHRPDSDDQNDQDIHNAPVRRPRDSIQNISINEIGDLIRKITLTRNKVIEFSNNRRFEDLIKKCFVRYHSQSSNSSKSDSYVIAQIVGITQGAKQYVLTGTQKSKVLLKLQESSSNIVSLPINMVSNQAQPGGNLEITKWLGDNTDKILTEAQIKRKLQEHKSLLTEKLSSEDIDKNIFNKAKSIAEKKIQTKQDVTYLVDFMIERIDNFQALEQEEISKRNEDKLNLIRIRREKSQAKEILQKLKEIRAERYKESRNENKEASESQNAENKTKPAFRLMTKREDTVREKCKLRQMMLCTAEGYKQIKINVLESHAKYDFDIEI